MKKIVVTGATSMIGVALINAVLQDVSLQKIYAVIRPGTKKRSRIPDDPRIAIIPCGVEDYKNLPALVSDSCEVFYHLAWPRTATYEEGYEDICLKCENIQTVLEAVRAAAVLGCKKFVGAGSQSEYGVGHSGKLSPETACNPVRADGVIHLAAGQLARILSSKLGLDCIWMRIFSVYGRYDRPNSLISSTIAKLRRGERCSFTPSGQIWDFLAAEDAGRAFFLVGEKGMGSHVYCVGKGEGRPLREYIEVIRDIVSPGAKLGFGEIPYPKDPVMELWADIGALQRDVGWQPAIEFEEGIRLLWEEAIEG